MKYLILIGLLFIATKVYAQCSNYDFDETSCVNDVECKWSEKALCVAEGAGNGCCEDVTSTPTIAPTTPPTCPDKSSASNVCNGYEQDCCIAQSSCYWKQTALCLAEGGPTCCEEVTPYPTTSPTCPDTSSNANPCRYLSEDCCPTNICQWSTSELCQSEGGPYCCEMITPQPTTAEPTTAEPTTGEPTTNEPTPAPTCPVTKTCEYEDSYCCRADTACNWANTELCNAEGGPDCCVIITPQPTTFEPTTSQPTTFEPTTSQPTTFEPTTVQPTTFEPTTSQPTTFEPTTRITPEPTKATPEPTRVTPEPTKATPEPTKATPEPTRITPEPTWPTPA